MENNCSLMYIYISTISVIHIRESSPREEETQVEEVLEGVLSVEAAKAAATAAAANLVPSCEFLIPFH